ncbi:capsule biosynthesis protein [Amphritea japonica]|uniref:Capsular polysaccharide export protein n=1 Tax=Amphritea japonica ATCC BAA-1530 TaxID=1278309 RepID=A0A7R6P9M3_9GAMM|nr:capsular biosynthesis protein [Amphritea japonica]BBB25116.1 capsular polysaccharide export protein [Amphritea japonica ATCC BAA-1530]
MRNSKKVFLLLQGPPSGFSAALSKGLQNRGAKCLKINFCLGEWLFWQGAEAINYRGTLTDWPGFLVDFIKQHNVTDVVYYADRLPYHRLAIDIAADLGINAITYENGYLRPYWITLEHGGMSRLSHFPTDPGHILEEGKKHPAPTIQQGLGHPFWQEARNEVVYNLANFFDIAFFRRYQADKVYNPLYEYLNYIPRLLQNKKQTKIARKVITGLKSKRFFLFPLQMQNDYQLRENSPFQHQTEAITLAISALSESAEQDTHLLFKIHPMDNGIESWSDIINDLTTRYKLNGRVWYIDGGNLDHIIRDCAGTVTINSTVGVTGIQKLKPVITLGDAMYDIPGLTSQQTLKAFFQQPQPPNPELVDSFIRLMAATIQVHGSFISEKGREFAISEMSERLINNRVNQPGALLSEPPRNRKTN